MVLKEIICDRLGSLFRKFKQKDGGNGRGVVVWYGELRCGIRIFGLVLLRDG